MFNEPFNVLARSRTYTDDSTEILKWIARIFQTVLDKLEIRLLLVRFAKMCSRRPKALPCGHRKRFKKGHYVSVSR